MRTTVTLDADVARALEEAMHREKRSFKAVLNDAIRRGLSRRPKHVAKARFRVVPHQTELQPGLDPAGFNRLSDELESEAFVARLRR